MPRTPRPTSDECLRALQRAGWFISRQSGSHAIMHHADHPGRRVTLPRHRRGVLRPKTLEAILDSAGLTVEEFAKLV